MRNTVRCALALSCAAISRPAWAQPDYYVNAAAPPGGDGLSWATAFQDPQTALDAQVDQRVEIWVAAGTYYPTLRVDPTDPRSAVIAMTNRHALYGGFAGNETSRSQRDPAANLTIFSGDLGLPGDPSDNAYHVVMTRLTDPSTILDGVTVRDGYGAPVEQNGAGLLAEGSSMQIRSCIFENNYAQSDGAAIYIMLSGTPAIIDVVIRNNVSADLGAAVSISRSQATLLRCRFEDNQGKTGGGLRIGYGSCQVIDCTFVRNRAGIGAGLATQNTRDLIMLGCTFEDNIAEFGSGGALVNVSAEATIEGCTFVGNSAGLGDGGGLALSASQPSWIRNCRFERNTSGRDGGAIMAVLHGGGVFGCLMSENSAAAMGGGIYVNPWALSPVLACTVYGNTAGGVGGGYYNAGPAQDAQALGSIYWANSDSTGSGEASQLASLYGTPVVNASVVQGWSGSWGGYLNSGADPLLADPASGDFGLLAGSPCIDAGDNNGIPPEFVLDLIGEPRFADDPATIDTGYGAPPLIDIGAIEYQSEARPFVLSVSGDCFSVSPMLVSWAGALPGSHVVLLFSASTGGVYIPPGYPCAGIQLGLGPSRLAVALEANSDAQGQRHVFLFTPQAACTGFVQAIERQRCWTSNVVPLD